MEHSYTYEEMYEFISHKPFTYTNFHIIKSNLLHITILYYHFNVKLSSKKTPNLHALPTTLIRADFNGVAYHEYCLIKSKTILTFMLFHMAVLLDSNLNTRSLNLTKPLNGLIMSERKATPVENAPF